MCLLGITMPQDLTTLTERKPMPTFSHLDEQGSVRMVDVSEKPATVREAVAQAVIAMRPETFDLIRDQKVKKGNVLEMCHPLLITHVKIDFFPQPGTHSIRIEAIVNVVGKTGVEMEALTAASVAALTVYDMCKSYDRAMTISDVCLLRKSGGKSGTFARDES
jgi:cyclic pyranopterin phosphate synthase